MKILMMVNAFPPAPCGGAEKQCRAQALALAARGHEVTVATEWLNRRHARKESGDGIRIARFGFLLPLCSAALRLGRPRVPDRDRAGGNREADCRLGGPDCERPVPRRVTWIHWWREWSFIVEVAWAVWTRRLQADVVHVHESGWIAGFAHWVAEKLRVPVVCKEACGQVLRWPERKDVPWLSRWEKRRSQCAFIAITGHVRRELEMAGIPARRIFDVPNGVALPETLARPEESGDAVYAGNFSQGADFKGFDVLLQAWGLVHREIPEMRLRLYGGGDARPWRQLAEAEGTGDSVAFPGAVADLVPAFAQAGFLVLPSRVEGLSNVLLEAQSVGLPAVVSDIPGNRSVVTDGVNGLVVPVGDVPALAEAMLKLRRAPELRARLGQAARETIARRFDIAGVAARLEEIYRALRRAGNSPP